MVNKNVVRLAIFIILLYLLPSSVIAIELESYQHINEIAVAFVTQHTMLEPDETLNVRVNESANQLQLAKCEQPININLPEGTTSQQLSTLEMSCHGQKTWRVYVPIEMKILTKVVVAKQTIPGKEIISEDMLDFAEYDKNALYSGYFKEYKEIIGQTPVTTIMPGTVISKRNIQQPILISRNQNVAIIAHRGAIMVRAEGVAKASGAFNDTIKVFNPSSKRMIDAVVVSSSSVEVR